jgi:hypothetical protein
MCSLADLAPWIGIEGTLLSSVENDSKVLRNSCTQVSQRIVGDQSRATHKVGDDKSTLPMFTDIMTLSLCLWSMALLGLRLPQEGQVGELLAMVDDALIVAAYLKDRSTGGSMELLLYALTRELCAVALGALLMVQNRSASAFSEANSQKAAEQLRDGRLLFHSTANSNNEDRDVASDNWIEEVDGFFKLAAFIWTRFDLDRLRDLAHLRRLQFNVISRNLRPDDQTRIKPLMESASPALNRAGYLGILANSVVASCYRPSAELSADFALQAAHFAIKNRLGLSLRNELAMVAIDRGHALGYDLEPFLRLLVDPGAGGKSPMRAFLGVIPTAGFTNYALPFLNASAVVNDRAVAESVLLQVQEVTRLLPDQAERTEAETLLKYHALNQQVKYDGGLTLAEELLTEWEGHRNSWFYPAILDILISKGNPTERTYNQAYAILRRNPLDDLYNSFMNLAVDLAAHAVDVEPTSEDRAALVTYLQGGVFKWEATRTAKGNLKAYRLLSSLDSNNQFVYAAKIDEWQKIKIEQDHTKRLRELALREKYLLIFREYCDSALFWGLQQAGGNEMFIKHEKGGFAGRNELLQAWVAEGSIVPEPLVSYEPLVVSSPFLWIGQTLFAPPADQDSSYDEARTQFNDTAKRNLTSLLDGILLLPDIPSDVRNLLSTYAAQFLEETGLRAASTAPRA